MPCGDAALTTIGRGGQFWLSMCETHVRNAMTLGDLLVREPRVGHEAPVPLLGVVARRILKKLTQIGVAPLLGNLGQVRCVVGALAEQRVAVDAVLAVPDVLAGDDLRRDGFRVRQLAELMWLWIVRPRKIIANTVVPTKKNKRVCRLVMRTSDPERRRGGTATAADQHVQGRHTDGVRHLSARS